MDKTSTQSKPEARRTSASGKLAFLGKLMIFLVTFGFVYPTLFSD